MHNAVRRISARWSLALGAILALALALCVQSTSMATVLNESITRAGWFVVVWGDRFGDQPISHTRYYLSDGETSLQLIVDETQLESLGGALVLNGKPVLVTGEMMRAGTSSEAPVTLTVQAIELSPELQEPHSPQSPAQPTGVMKFVSVMCKFAGNTSEPQNLAFFQNMYGSTPPRLDHFFLSMSYGATSVAGSTAHGWYTLPYTRGHYIGDFDGDGYEEAKLKELAIDCTAAADADIDYRNYQGINLMFNDNLDCCAWGGGETLTRDGVTRWWRMTWEPPWGYRDISVIQHEMGHAFGMPHSSGMYGHTYDNAWDVMSNAFYNCTAPYIDPVYGCIGQGVNAFNRLAAGFIPSAQYKIVNTGNNLLLPLRWLDTLTPIPPTEYRMIKVPIRGSSSHYYTIEARRRFMDGAQHYDTKLPADAVVIHEVGWKGINQSWLVDVDGNTRTDDAGAMWGVGETFYDRPNGITITVESPYGSTGYAVRVQNSGASGLPGIHGYVNNANGTPLANATVSFNVDRPSVTTNSTGYYFQTGFSNGTVQVLFEHPHRTFAPKQQAVLIDGRTMMAHATAYNHPAPAPLPFSENFVTTTLGTMWGIETTQQGRVRVELGDNWGRSGVLRLDDRLEDNTYSLASAILALNLSGYSQVELQFRYYDVGTEKDAEIRISDDYGARWHTIGSLTQQNTWVNRIIDLDAALAGSGMSFINHFWVQFKFYDNYPLDKDGFGIDDIRVFDTSAAIKGRVATASGIGVPGVNVRFTGGRPTVQTDANGYYTQTNFAVGTYTVTVSHTSTNGSTYALSPAKFGVPITNPNAQKTANVKATPFVYRSLPYFWNFESGSLDSNNVLVETTFDGSLRLKNAGYQSTWALLLEDKVNDDLYSDAAAILAFNVGSAISPWLEFWWRTYNEVSAGNGVYISADDGATWHGIYSFNSGGQDWTYAMIDLRAAAISKGLAWDKLAIKLASNSNSPYDVDGVLIDNLRVSEARPILGALRTSTGTPISDTIISFAGKRPNVKTNVNGAYTQTGFFPSTTVSVTASRSEMFFTPLVRQFTTSSVTATHNITGYALPVVGLTQPYTNGFESAAPLTGWLLETTQDGRARVGTANARTGSKALTLDVPGGGGWSRAAAILPLDLSNAARVSLNFWYRKELADSDLNGVFLSDNDGISWVKVFSFTAASGAYQQVSLSLDQLADAKLMEFNARFLVKFQCSMQDTGSPYDACYIDDLDIGRTPYTLQGLIRKADLTAIEGVTVTFSGIRPAVTTNASGFYSQTGFTTTVNVAVEKPGYVFNPKAFQASATADVITRNITGYAINPANLAFVDNIAGTVCAAQPNWAFETQNGGRITLSSAHYHLNPCGLLLDNGARGISGAASAILPLNLADQSSAILEFWWYKFDTDTLLSPDNVAISDDFGASWHTIFTFPNAASTAWTKTTIDLNEAAIDNRLVFTDGFMLRFYNSTRLLGGGLALDEVQVFNPDVYTPYSISGTVRDESFRGVPGVTVSFGGARPPVTTTASGYYAQSAFVNGGTYTVTFSNPRRSYYLFAPWRATVTISDRNASLSSFAYWINPVTIPYSTSFEAKPMPAHWGAQTTNQGEAIPFDSVARTGTRSLLLHDYSATGGIYSQAGGALALDLSRESQVKLSFWWRESNDEDHADDGVFVSNDYGLSWKKIYSFTGSVTTFTQTVIDLDAAAKSVGVAFNDHYLVKFNYYGDRAWPNDGYAIDDVSVERDAGLAFMYGRILSDRPSGNLSSAVVRIITGTTTLVQGVSDSSGEYGELWVAPGVYTVTVNRTGYLAESRVVSLTAGANGFDQTMTRIGPRISYEPTELDAEGDLASAITRTVRIANSGNTTMTFALLKQPAADWLTVSPASGDIPVGSSQNVDILFNGAAAVQPGEYTTTLVINSNDPISPVVSLPVKFNVVMNPLMGELRGIVFSDRPGGVISGALVSLNAGTHVLSMTLDDTGEFQRWLMPGMVTITTSADGYVTDTQTVQVFTGEAMKVEVVLAWNQPKVALEQKEVDVSLPLSTSLVITFALNNDGPAAMNYTISDALARDWLKVKPMDGTVPPYDIQKVSLKFDAGNLGVLLRSALAGQGVYTTTLNVLTNDPDTPLINLPITITVTDPQPILRLTKAANSATAQPGSAIVYTLTVRNTGSAAATSVALSDVLPAHTSFASASGGGIFSNGMVTWAPTTLASNATLTVTLRVTVAAPLPNLTPIANDTYSVTCAELDDVIGAPVIVTVQSAPVLSITSRSPITAFAGLYYTSTLVVRNSGNADANEVMVTSTLPLNTSFAWADWEGHLAEGNVRWIRPELLAGRAFTMTFAVRVSEVNSGTLLTNAQQRIESAEDVWAIHGAINTTAVRGPRVYMPVVIQGD